MKEVAVKQEPQTQNMHSNNVGFTREKIELADNVLQCLSFAKKPALKKLYLKCPKSKNLQNANDLFLINEGAVVSTDTYFNAFCISNYRKYTNVNKFALKIRAKGSFRVSIYQRYCRGDTQVLFEKDYALDASDEITIDIPEEWSRVNDSRIYYTIEAIDGLVELHDSQYIALGIPVELQKCAIVIRTFKRKSDVLELLHILADDERLISRYFRVFVLDGSSELNEEDVEAFTGKPFSFVNAENYGSSGALNRTFFAFKKVHPDFNPNVFVILDDDIYLDTESIFRTWKVFSTAKNPDKLLLSGTMMSRTEPLEVSSIVGNFSYLGDPRQTEPAPMTLSGTGLGLNASKDTDLDELSKRWSGNCAAFYLMAVSAANCCDGNWAPALYMKMDDIEFTYALHKKGVEIVGFPGIAAWHNPFHIIMQIWQQHLEIRHSLICDAIHRDFSAQNCWTRLEYDLNRYICTHNYIAAEMILDAVGLLLQGPGENFAARFILESEQNIKNQAAKFNALVSASKLQMPSPRSLHLRYVEGLTSRRLSRNVKRYYNRSLNGNRFPTYHKKNDFAVVDAIWPNSDAAIGYSKVWHFNTYGEQAYLCEFNKQSAKALLNKCSKVKQDFISNYDVKKKEWRDFYPEMKSNKFWEAVFANEKASYFLNCLDTSTSKFEKI